MADLGERTKSYYLLGDTFGARLRKMGYFFAAAKTHSHAKIDSAVNACYILCLRDYGYLLKMGEAIEKSNVDKELLAAINLFFFLISKNSKD